MNDADASRLRHMLDASRAVQKFVLGKTRDSLDTDQQIEFALEKAFEIIGEAAGKITQATREEYPQIAWKQMIGMRNILIHGYMDIDRDQVWKAVADAIPVLTAQLEKIIPPETP